MRRLLEIAGLVLMIGPACTRAAAPSVSESPSPPFACADHIGGVPAHPLVNLTKVTITGNTGFDRFMLEFDQPVPPFQVARRATPTFIQDASGLPVTLQGSAGVQVRLESITLPPVYSGPNDLKPGLPVLLQTRLVGGFEGVVTWGLGLARATCLRVFTLKGPPRLVVDLQAA